MAQSLNRVFLIGRLGRDPELRHTADGKPVATLSLATRRPAPTGAEPDADWHRIVCWTELAERAARQLAKGRLVYVAGRLEYRSWEGRDGARHRGVEVVASELVPLDRRPDAGSESEPFRDDDDATP